MKKSIKLFNLFGNIMIGLIHICVYVTIICMTFGITLYAIEFLREALADL